MGSLGRELPGVAISDSWEAHPSKGEQAAAGECREPRLPAELSRGNADMHAGRGAGFRDFLCLPLAQENRASKGTLPISFAAASFAARTG